MSSRKALPLYLGADTGAVPYPLALGPAPS